MSRNDQSNGFRASDALIDRNVRLLYDGLIEEGLPDRFKELIDLIRAEDHQQDTKTDDDA